MKDIFDVNRFGKYLAYDLNNAFASYGVSLLLCGLMPVILLLFFGVFSLIFTHSWAIPPAEMITTIFFIALFVVIIGAPAKIYGPLTEKKMGSDWLMIPSSSFEKFLSMMVVLCVVLPVAFFALFFFADWLLSVLVNSYDQVILPALKDIIMSRSFLSEGSSEVYMSNFSLFSLGWATWAMNILVFALGALMFKKSKVAKTFFSLIIISMVLSSIIALFFEWFDLDDFLTSSLFERIENNPQFYVNLVINFYYTVVIAALAVCIFFRVKTLKH